MKKRVIAYLQTHWDREWYRTKEEFNIRLVEVIDGVLDELKKNNAPSFYFDGQVSALEDYLFFRPEKTNLIKKLIKEKKLYIGPFYVSSDSFLVDAYMMEKNLELGIKIAKSFGQEEFIGYFPDSFGHSKGISTLMKKFNIDKSIIWRGVNSTTADFLYDDIKMTWLPQGYFFDILHTNLDIEKKAEITENILDKIAKYSSDTLLLPIGGDHLGILKSANKLIQNINKYLKNYEIILSNPFEYFNLVKYTEKINTEFLDNSNSYILGGVYSIRVKEKIANKILSEKLKNIEKLNKLTKNDFDPFILNATKTLIKNHTHDSIYGCSIDEVNENVKLRFQKVENILNYIERKILNSCKKPKKDEIGIYNLSENTYPNIVRFKSIKKIKNAQIISKTKGFPEEILFDVNRVPITEDFCTIYEQIAEIPKIPFDKFSLIKPLIPNKKTKISEKFIENDFLKFEIENGKINIIDKIKQEKLINFINIIDTKDLGDSYNYAPKSSKTLNLLSSKIIENGIIRSKLRIFYKNIKFDVILYNNSKNIEFELDINNKTKNHKLQIVFNLKNNIEKTIVSDLYGEIQRNHNPNYRLLDNMPPKGREEVKTNTYPMKDYVWGNGLGIYTIGLNEYETYKNTISVSLLRSTGIISTPKNPARFCPAGPPIDIPNAQIIGNIKEKFMISFNKFEECKMINEKYLENYFIIC